ncbi:MAG TPA: hypothetical protein VM240_12195 [Verrucomicrobiae bacterium]|nr:hypothetical protein [Verrucomicrobiae bacterium]
MNEQIFLDHARVRFPHHEPTLFTCDPNALDAAARTRHREVTRELLLQAGAPRELPDGFAFAVGVDRASLELAAEFVSRERLCCPFLAFRIEADRGPDAWLTLTGPSGVKPFLRAELELA